MRVGEDCDNRVGVLVCNARVRESPPDATRRHRPCRARQRARSTYRHIAKRPDDSGRHSRTSQDSRII